MFVTTEVFDQAALAALIADAVILGADVHVGLYTNVIAPRKTNVIADFTEPVYAGYARQAVLFGAPFRDPRYAICSLAAPITFQQLAGITPTVVQGYFLVTGAGPILLAASALTAPFAMVDGLDALTLAMQYIQSSAAPGFANVII